MQLTPEQRKDLADVLAYVVESEAEHYAQALEEFPEGAKHHVYVKALSLLDHIGPDLEG